MVIFYSQLGQLANRLWQAAFLISNAIENNHTFLHLGFAEYLVYFEENSPGQLKKNGGNCRIINFKTTSIQDRLIIKYVNYSTQFRLKHKYHLPFIKQIDIAMGDEYDISQDAFKKWAKNKIVIPEGWIFVDKSSLKKNADVVRQIFKPNQSFIDNINIIKNDQFSKYDKIIGVHIRRKDYSTFNNGKWFYSNDAYISIIKKTLLALDLESRKIGFLLCSDEKINTEEFKEFNIINSTNHFVEDLYALSNCDYIIGPPSTYSAWASFYGNKPLLHIYDLEAKITNMDFKIVEN